MEMQLHTIKHPSVVGLLPGDSSDWLRSPEALAVLTALDIGIAQGQPDTDGFIDIPLSTLLEASTNLMSLFMTLSLLPPGFAQMCGEAPDGTRLLPSEDERANAFLDYMATQEATGKVPPKRMFYRVDAAMLKGLDVGCAERSLC